MELQSYIESHIQNKERLLAYAGAALGVFSVAIIVDREFFKPLRSPLNTLRGPPLDTKKSQDISRTPQDNSIFGHSSRWLNGNAAAYDVQERWSREYGKTFVYRGLLQVGPYTSDFLLVMLNVTLVVLHYEHNGPSCCSSHT